jgi:hypothetical protein
LCKVPVMPFSDRHPPSLRGQARQVVGQRHTLGMSLLTEVFCLSFSAKGASRLCLRASCQMISPAGF